MRRHLHAPLDEEEEEEDEEDEDDNEEECLLPTVEDSEGEEGREEERLEFDPDFLLGEISEEILYYDLWLYQQSCEISVCHRVQLSPGNWFWLKL